MSKDASSDAGKKNVNDSTVGLNQIKTDAQGKLMSILTRFTGSDFAEKYNLAPIVDKVAYNTTKTGVQTAGAASRQFKKIRGSGKPVRPATTGTEDGTDAPTTDAAAKGYFDLHPTDDQAMIIEAVKEFATEQMRPAAHDANEKALTPENVKNTATELGITLMNIPEEFEGLGNTSGVTTGALIAEALSYGDMGQAVSLLAPAGVANAITNYGDDSQQKTYLPDFASENVPVSAVIVTEPHALFNPLELKTTVVREGSELVINGTKSLVPNAAENELLVVGVNYAGAPAFVIVPSDAQGITVEADPSMGIRAAALGQVHFEDVRVPAENLLGGAEFEKDERTENYKEIIRRARLGWASLAVGTMQAVLDYTSQYVNEREAFGEPISHRQAVAFMVANIRIELDGLKLITLRGASRADQGLSYHREAGLAKTFATDKGMQVGLDGVQLLGGHGYTKEHPVERWYRDLRALGVAEGIVVL